MTTPSSRPASSQQRDQRSDASKAKGDQAKQQPEHGRDHKPRQQGSAPRGERPIADVDRKVRGGDA